MGFKSCYLICKYFFALKYLQNFIIHLLGEVEEENNWLLKLLFLKTSETHLVLKIQQFPESPRKNFTLLCTTVLAYSEVQ